MAGFIEDDSSDIEDLGIEAENQIYVDKVVPLEDSEKQDEYAYNPILDFVKSRFERARTKRQSDEYRWLDAYRNYRGIYGPEVAFTDTEKSQVFIKVTKTKVLAAYAQIIEVLFAGNKFPISVEATPVSNGDLEESVHIDPTQDKVDGSGEQTPSSGVVSRPELFGRFKDLLSNVSDKVRKGPGTTPTSATWEPVKEAAKRMERLIHDQLDESEASKELRHLAFELCLFGTGILKGPFAYDKEYPRWDAEGKYSPRIEVVPKVSYVSIWDFYPDPEGRNIPDCSYSIERHRLSSSHLRDLNRRPYFRQEAIERALEIGANYIPEQWESVLEDNTTTVSTERFEVLEYWGVLDKDLLEYSGLEESDELSALDEIQANIWICNNEIIRLVLNPFTPKRLPYHAVPFELNPYSFFGIGVAENMLDTQMLMNGFMRMAVDNAVISGNIVLEVDENNLVPGQSMDVYPGKIFRKQGGQTGQTMYGIKFPNISNELMQLYDKARQLTDEATSMPSYAHGGTGVSGMGRTAAGMSMLMGAASQSIKANVRNIDDYLLSPLGKAMFAFNMQFNFDKEFIVGDLAVVPMGTESLMRNEVRSQKLLQVLQLGANPMDAPFLKRDYIWRELITSLDLDEEKIVNDPRTALIQATMMKKMNEAMGVPQQGQQGPQDASQQGPQHTPGISVNDPTGNGAGTIGPGQAPEPDARGFTGSGGGANGGNSMSSQADSANV